MNNATFHQESHLAQQLRRDKLRFLQSPPPTTLNSYNDLTFPSTSQPQIQVYNAREPFWPECVNELALLPASQHRASSEQGLSLSLSPNPVPEAGDVVGPLGPFTGYAAVLRGSSFLRPGQQLLEEFCRVALGSRRSDVERGCNGWWGNLSLSFADGGNGRAGGGAGGSGSLNGYQFQQKLLYLQEEVSRRYKQCHQQIQMVVSSFESVPGLCSATPYTSLALKSVMKHFQNLKNAITDQLNRANKIASNEFMPSPGPGIDETTTRIKYIGQSIQKEKSAGNNFNFLENSQPLWRPQRGLPERAVAVLRAWLFDHFLHPYPTDTDKHILAAQTGLSRNQVSNWFINARVRLWKPMVEEIHTLEIKGTNGMDLNPSTRNGGNQPSDRREHPSSDQMRAVEPGKMIDQISKPMINEDSHRSMEHWHREKRLRVEEWRIPTCMDGSLMSLAGYPAGMDIGGLGAVSLTLGLQHNEDAQQQHQMRHFGSHVVHDFEG